MNFQMSMSAKDDLTKRLFIALFDQTFASFFFKFGHKSQNCLIKLYSGQPS